MEDVISLRREALVSCPPGHPDRLSSLGKLAISLSTRFDQLGRMEDLEEAISSYREVLTLCPPGHSDRSFFLNKLAGILFTRFDELERTEDLEEAISFHRQVLTLCPPGHPEHSSSLSNLATALYTRFRQLRRMEDLEEAISSHREALTLRPPGHRHRSLSLNNLATALSTRFKQLGRMEDLEEAISSHREVLTLCPPGHPNRFLSLINLAAALSTRFDELGRIEDLKEAILSHREALPLHPPGYPHRSSSLNNFALALFTCFEQLGRMEDLEEAILFHREALTLCPPGHPNRFFSLNNIALALSARFDQLARMEDLKEAISSYREALTLRPPGHPDHSMSLNGLAGALSTRFDQLARMEDLEEAISSHRKVLTLCPPGHPNRSFPLNNLATALHTCFKKLGKMQDLEDAISYLRKALVLCPPGHPNRFVSLNNLASILSTRFDQLGRMEDLEEAISSHREALTLLPPGHPRRSWCLRSLANALSALFNQLRKIDYLEEIFHLYDQAANDLASSSLDRLTATKDWVTMARRHHHKSVICAYSTSLRLLGRCLILYPNVNLQQKFLATVRIPRSLASDAASAAIEAGKLDTAVELLEEGRAVLWSRMHGFRYSLDLLYQADSQLADRLETLNRELEHLELSSESRPIADQRLSVPAALEAQMRQHRILSEEWEDVVRRVRQIKGFANFLQAIPFSTLRAAAVEGPIILINISQYRSDAIILHPNNPHPILVPLPDTGPQQLSELAAQLDSARDGSISNPSKVFISILRDLWESVISPVHNCLVELGVPEKSRTWWCPTSELCALPLHAAGPYLPKQKNLPDIYIHSYIPTISSLIRARSNILGNTVDVVPKLLVIGQPETLPKVYDEIDHIQQLGDFVNVMIGAQANGDSILQSLQRQSWVHFACHGHLGKNGQPFQASFELSGGSRLTLLDLIQARLPNAELAFLSACHSAAGDLTTPDETIHLAAALQFCGFRSVVGTLWAMSDEDGPTISKEFYKHIFRKSGNRANFRDSAEALSLAIREMRRNCVPLDRWIMFVHIGA